MLRLQPPITGRPPQHPWLQAFKNTGANCARPSMGALPPKDQEKGDERKRQRDCHKRPELAEETRP